MNPSALPAPQFVLAGEEGVRIATYTWGGEGAPVAVLVHGFASNVQDNWVDTLWIDDLRRAGFRVLGIDLRGHGASGKSHRPEDYSIPVLAADVETVLDAYAVDSAVYVGYSFGARLGWDIARDLPHRIERAVLGGFPYGFRLPALDVPALEAHIDEGLPVRGDAERSYLRLTERLPRNDPRALLAFTLGARTALSVDVDPGTAPPQALLFATGSEDPLRVGARALVQRVPGSAFFEIPGRHHFNAPGSAAFRKAALAFLPTT